MAHPLSDTTSTVDSSEWVRRRKSQVVSAHPAVTSHVRSGHEPPERAEWVGPIQPEDLVQRKTPASFPFPAVQPKVVAPPEKLSWIEKLALGLTLVMGLAGMVGLGFWLFKPKPTLARVEAIGWSRVETLQEVQTHRGEGWRDNRENVRWGDCTPRRDGTTRRTWCTYTYQAWETLRTEGLSGSDHEPRWFGLVAKGDTQRVVRDEDFWVRFQNARDRTQTWETHVRASDYESYNVGQMWETYQEREWHIPLRLQNR